MISVNFVNIIINIGLNLAWERQVATCLCVLRITICALYVICQFVSQLVECSIVLKDTICALYVVCQFVGLFTHSQ